MGTPVHNWTYQSQFKLYRLQTPATPLFRPAHYDALGMDDYPMGTNALIAVISYTVSSVEILEISIRRKNHTSPIIFLLTPYNEEE